MPLSNLFLGAPLNVPAFNRTLGQRLAGFKSLPVDAGYLGVPINLDDAQALAKSDTTIGTLYRGQYKIVKVAASANIANMVVGATCFWSDRTNYTITDAVASPEQFAGILIAAPAAVGDYLIIQTKGKATAKYVASITGGTTAGLAIFASTASAAVDTQANATAATVLMLKTLLGIAIDAPVAGALKLVELNPFAANY